MSEVFQKCASLAGRWPKRLEPLAELGIETVYDLLTHFPFRYEDIQIRDVQTIMDQEKVTLKGLWRRNRLSAIMASRRIVWRFAWRLTSKSSKLRSLISRI